MYHKLGNMDFSVKEVNFFFENIMGDKVKVVKFLLENKPDLMSTRYGFKKQTALHCCKSVKMLELILNKGGSPNGTDSQWDTPLTVFSTKGYDENIDMIRILVERGADVNQQDILQRNALFYCSCHLTDLLVEIGTRINDRDVDGNTPLQYMCESLASVLKIHKLIELGADPRVVSNGKTAEDILCGNQWHFHGGDDYFRETIELFHKVSQELCENEKKDETWKRRREFALLVFSYRADTVTEKIEETGDLNAIKRMIEDGVSGEGYELFDKGKEWGRLIMEYV